MRRLAMFVKDASGEPLASTLLQTEGSSCTTVMHFTAYRIANRCSRAGYVLLRASMMDICIQAGMESFHRDDSSACGLIGWPDAIVQTLTNS